jgi:hypothetical protein
MKEFEIGGLDIRRGGRPGAFLLSAPGGGRHLDFERDSVWMT